MIDVIDKPHKGDEKAEWCPIDSVRCSDPTNIFCPVCGENYSTDIFHTGHVETCGDCGLFLEIVDGHLVIFEDPANPVPPFYNR